MFELTKEQFLDRNRISEADWEKANCKWEDLQLIANDHLAHQESLITAAEMSARMVQRIDGVHSVRFRVKDVEHLLEKIVRKRAEVDPQEKYLTIDVDNYHEVVTDLVGIRALHLFKVDCLRIDEGIRLGWQLKENPVAYVREGDPLPFRQELEHHGFKVKDHKAGYRSIHYVVTTRPGKREVLVEVQVRTIFEEGWSEIDHKIRYPNFSDNPLVAYFLAIFNRMAGSADEMGSFVRELTARLVEGDSKLQAAMLERDGAIESMEQAINEAEQGRQDRAALEQSFQKLKREFNRLKASAQGADSATAKAIESVQQSEGISKSNRLVQMLYGGRYEELQDRIKSIRADENSLMARIAASKGLPQYDEIFGASLSGGGKGPEHAGSGSGAGKPNS